MSMSPDPEDADHWPDLWPDGEDETGPMVTYAAAPDSLIQHWMQRRKRMELLPRESLPPLDVDLEPLLAARIPANEPPLTGKQSLHGRKLHGMRVELAGKPELAALNAILIAHLRKRRYPAHAPALFRRIWTEAGAALMPELPGRWLISSAITFGDHGETEAQRRIGLAMNVLFSLMKLYEFERIQSGADPAVAYPPRSAKGKRLPLGMPNFALVGGGLDINLLAQIWNEARQEPVAGALACHLLQRLNEDPGNIFRRIALMRTEAEIDRMSSHFPPDSPEVG